MFYLYDLATFGMVQLCFISYDLYRDMISGVFFVFTCTLLCDFVFYVFYLYDLLPSGIITDDNKVE